MVDEKMIFAYDDYKSNEEMRDAIIRSLSVRNKSFQIEYKNATYDLEAILQHTSTQHLSGYNVSGFRLTGYEGKLKELDLTFLKENDVITADLNKIDYLTINLAQAVNEKVNSNYMNNYHLAIKIDKKLTKAELREIVQDILSKHNGHVFLIKDDKICELKRAYKNKDGDEIVGGYVSGDIPQEKSSSIRTPDATKWNPNTDMFEPGDFIEMEEFYNDEDNKNRLKLFFNFFNKYNSKIEVDGDLVTLDNGEYKIRLNSKMLDEAEIHAKENTCFEVKCASKSEKTIKTLKELQNILCDTNIKFKNFPIPELKQSFQQEFAKKGYECTFVDKYIPNISFDNQTKQYISQEDAKTIQNKKQYIDQFKQIVDRFKNLCIQNGKITDWQRFDDILQKYGDTYVSLYTIPHQNISKDVTDKLKTVHLYLDNNIELPDDNNISYIQIDTELTSPSDINKLMNISLADGTPPKCPIVFTYNGREHTAYINEELNTKTNQFYRSINLIESNYDDHNIDFTFLSNAEIPNQHTITAFLSYSTERVWGKNCIWINSSMLNNSNIVTGDFKEINIDIDNKNTTQILKDYEQFMTKNSEKFDFDDPFPSIGLPDPSICIHGATLSQKLFLSSQIKKINKEIFGQNCYPVHIFEKDVKSKQPKKRIPETEKESIRDDIITEFINSNITEMVKKTLEEFTTQLDDMKETSTPDRRNELRDAFKEFLAVSNLLNVSVRDAYDDTIEIVDIDKLEEDILTAYMQQDNIRELLQHESEEPTLSLDEKHEPTKTAESDDKRYEPRKILMLEEKQPKDEQQKDKGQFQARRADDVLGKSYTKEEMLTLVEEDAMEWLPKASKVLRGDEDIAIAALKNNFMSYQLLDRQLFQKQSFQERLQKEIPAMHQMFKQAGMFNTEKQTDKQSEKTTDIRE